MAMTVTAAGLRGGKKTLGKKAPDAYQLIGRVRAGLHYSALESLSGQLHLSREEASRVLSIPPRTLARRKREQRLTPEESDRTLRLARVFSRAAETLEDQERAVRWLRTPNAALGMVVPLSLLDTDPGVREVERILGRIEHGVYS